MIHNLATPIHTNHCKFCPNLQVRCSLEGFYCKSKPTDKAITETRWTQAPPTTTFPAPPVKPVAEAVTALKRVTEVLDFKVTVLLPPTGAREAEELKLVVILDEPVVLVVPAVVERVAVVVELADGAGLEVEGIAVVVDETCAVVGANVVVVGAIDELGTAPLRGDFTTPLEDSHVKEGKILLSTSVKVMLLSWPYRAAQSSDPVVLIESDLTDFKFGSCSLRTFCISRWSRKREKKKNTWKGRTHQMTP